MIGSAATVLYGYSALCGYTVAHGHKMFCGDGTDKDVTNIPEKHPSPRAKSAVLERAGCVVPILGQPCPHCRKFLQTLPGSQRLVVWSPAIPSMLQCPNPP